MNILGGMLIAAFVIQYMLIRTVLFTYTVASLVLFVTFFYYEAPTYRSMLTVEKELEVSRERAEQATRMTNAANRAKSDFLITDVFHALDFAAVGVGVVEADLCL